MAEETYNIKLMGRIDSGNADEVEATVMKQVEENAGKNIVFDAGELSYISSAGLRILMKVKKKISSELLIMDVSPDIYEIFDSTGFTSLFNVKKKYREISIEGCKVIGKGFYGTVYRIDGDTIVKKYDSAEALSVIENEKRLAKIAFVAGVPTAISFDIVKIGNTFGSVFELIKSKTFIDLIIDNPDGADAIIKRYADFLKEIHAISIPSQVLPKAKDIFWDKLGVVAKYVSEEVLAKLKKLITDIPDDDHFIHGDYQMKNVMLSDGEPLLIDMDSICTGQPMFDLQGLFVTYVAFLEDEPGNSMAFSGITEEMSYKIWNGVLENYYEGKSREELEEICSKIKLLGYIRFLHLIDGSEYLRSGELGKNRIEHTIAHLGELAGKLNDLIID